MRKLLVPMLSGLVLLSTIGPAPAADPSPELAKLQGAWSLSRTNSEGRRSFRSLEFSGGQVTFQMRDADEELQFVAKGKANAEKMGPFNILTISAIRAGRSEDELEPTDDTRAYVFTLHEGQLVFASNFDRERENQPPGLEVYTRRKTATATAVGQTRLIGTWKLDVTLADQEYDYELRFAESNGKLQATFISPRSGEHKARMVNFKDEALSMELDRTIGDNDVTFVYEGKYSGGTLSGTLKVKGFEEQFTGKWTARK